MTTFLPKLRELIERANKRPPPLPYAINGPTVECALFLQQHADAIAEVVEALKGEVDNCANCGGTGEFEWNLEQHKCNRCARSRQALAKLTDL